MGKVLPQVLGDRPLALLVVVDKVGVGLSDLGPDTVEGSFSSRGACRMYCSNEGLGTSVVGRDRVRRGGTDSAAPAPGVSEEPCGTVCFSVIYGREQVRLLTE